MYPFQLEGFIADHVTGRPQSLFANDIQANAQALSERIDGKSVLVIGGAGSIGSSFIRAMLRFRPARLYVVDTNENGLTELTRDLRSNEDLVVPPVYLTYPLNFGEPVFGKILRNVGAFDIVANFAAHKHVRSEKDPYAIEAMVDNNVLKAKQLLDLLTEHPPAHFFCVSTDKAANPVNVMGATKKLMEEVIMAYAARLPITTARFANVAFSNGSLLAGFLERLMKRQPLSAPSDVKRYFVSPEESGQICLLACMLGHSGEIFFPKLATSDMKTFSDIASALLRSLGLEPYPCASEQEAKLAASQWNDANAAYPVYYFGSDTSGEKSFEEFFTENEEIDWDRFESLGVIKNAPRKDFRHIDVMFQKLTSIFAKEKIVKTDIVRLLADFIPNFEHIETGKNLDDKM